MDQAPVETEISLVPLWSLMRFLSLRLKPKAAARPRIGRGPGTDDVADAVAIVELGMGAEKLLMVAVALEVLWPESSWRLKPKVSPSATANEVVPALCSAESNDMSVRLPLSI